MKKFRFTRPQVFTETMISFGGRVGAICLFTIAVSFCLGYMAREIRMVEIDDSAVPGSYMVYTYEKDPVEVLMREKQSLDLASVDTVSVAYINQNLAKINIARGFDVFVTADGKTRSVLMTHGDTASSAIARSGVNLNEDDEVNVALYTRAEEGMEIVIDRVSFDTVVKQEQIPFETVKNENDSIPKGTTINKQEGSEGVKEKTTRNKYVNGTLVSSNVIADVILKEPVNAVYELGTKEVPTPSGGSADISASGYLVCESTAYTYMTSDYSDVTASGRPAGYGNVAVDPSVIPLGTRLYITSLDGSYVYGYAIAADTGGAIRGNIVDLFFNTYSECISWGRRDIRVYILD